MKVPLAGNPERVKVKVLLDMLRLGARSPTAITSASALM